MPSKSPRTTKPLSPSRLAAPIIRPSSRDFEPHLFGRGLSPDAVGGLLDAGARGDLAAQNDLFNLMEDTWPRLRANLQKIKNAIVKLPFNVQPFTPKNGAPSPAALEKAKFIESVLHVPCGVGDPCRAALSTAAFELMDAVARGLAVVEIDWGADACGFLVPSAFRRVPSRYLGLAGDGTLALRLNPSAQSELSSFSRYPGKFLVGLFRSKSGALGEAAQLRALAPLWLGHMLGWEWLVQKAELFGLPLRWANYPPTATQTEIDAITSALRNMGSAAWGAFPQGTNLQILQGSIPGVAGPNDPSERLLWLADRACDILLLGQNLSSEINDEGSRAAAEVHREVELDLYETYAQFIVSILNDQLIPALIGVNWGDMEEVPFVAVEVPRPTRDEEMARRDQLLFVEMGLPVSLQYLYERHKVPAPGPNEALFHPAKLAAEKAAESPRKACGCGEGTPIIAASESTAELEQRRQEAADALPGLLAKAEAANEYLVWSAVIDERTTAECAARNGRRWGDGWFDPPPIHFNCRSTLVRVPKANYVPPGK